VVVAVTMTGQRVREQYCSGCGSDSDSVDREQYSIGCGSKSDRAHIETAVL